MRIQPVMEAGGRGGHQGEQGGLMEDARVERRGFDKEQELVAGQRVEVAQRREGIEHLRCERVRPLFVQDCAETLRQQLVRPHEVDAPHHTVASVVGRTFRGEVEGDQRRKRPVDQTRRQPMMLGHGEPVPDRINAGRLLRRVLAEVAEHRHLEPDDVGVAAREPHQTVREIVVVVGKPAERVRRAEALEVRVPGSFVEPIDELSPGARALHNRRACMGRSKRGKVVELTRPLTPRQPAAAGTASARSDDASSASARKPRPAYRRLR